MSSRTIMAFATAASVLALNAPAALAGSPEKTIYRFTGGLNGDSPIGGLVADSAGNLYGAASFDGGDGFGLLYELSPNGKNNWTYKVIYTFQGSDGAFPEANLTFDAAGNLYGTTEGGGPGGQNWGTVFEMSRDQGGNWNIVKSFAFSGGPDGFAPSGGVVLDAAGNVYTTAKESRQYNGFGTVVELSPSGDGWNEQTIHTFTYGDDGAYPCSGLTIDKRGDLFGTASDAGSGRQGVVFKLHNTKKGWVETVLHAFQGGSDGSAPEFNVVFDRAGNLYGTTLQGDTVFELVKPAHEDARKKGAWDIVQVHQFGTGTDGNSAYGIAIDKQDNLYGVTGVGGSTDSGVVYKLTPSDDGGRTTWNESILWDIPGGVDGGHPSGIPILNKGKLYGTAAEGNSGHGVVFEVKTK